MMRRLGNDLLRLWRDIFGVHVHAHPHHREPFWERVRCSIKEARSRRRWRRDNPGKVG